MPPVLGEEQGRAGIHKGPHSTQLHPCPYANPSRLGSTDQHIIFSIWGPNFRRDLKCRVRSEEHTSELQSHSDLVCRLLLEKKKQRKTVPHSPHPTHKH